MTTAIRYPAKAAHRARELHDAGWSTHQLPALIAAEFGNRPSKDTVVGWVNPRYAAKRADRNRAAMVERRRADRKPRANHSAAWCLDRMRELRAGRLSYRDIGVVAGLWWGTPLTEEQVRYQLRGAA